MGTRFVASAESGNHASYKAKIMAAKFSDLVETTLFDGGWPESPHRVIRNSTLTRWEQAGRPAPGARPGEGERIGTAALQCFNSLGLNGRRLGSWASLRWRFCRPDQAS
jgi:NAD(P)H-dependent flavin oxidoreductase YrpB (nitropropane dioxygenase family)